MAFFKRELSPVERFEGALKAKQAQACESRGDLDEAKEWRHIEDAMKIMRGPHQS